MPRRTERARPAVGAVIARHARAMLLSRKVGARHGHTCLYMRGRDVRLGGVVRGGGVLAIMLVHGQIYDVTYLKAGQATR